MGVISLKHKFIAIMTAISLLILNIAIQPVLATQVTNKINVSSALVRNTMKVQLMEQDFQLKQKKQADQAKLKAIKIKQQQWNQMEQKQAIQRAQKAKQAIAQAPKPQIRTINKGTFKVSFYDPAVLGSRLGYHGVAANLNIFPRGTRLRITLSNGMVLYRVVNDTGSFAYSNPRQLDVAMPNSQIPAAGILYASVEVIY